MTPNRIAGRVEPGRGMAFAIQRSALIFSSQLRRTGIMPVFRWGHPWDAFQDLEREVDRLLSGVNIAFHGIRIARQYPAINLYELADEFLLTAELPGTRAEDLELTIVNGLLQIKGRREGDGVPDERYRRQERFRGAWQRAISVPDRIREDALRAEFVDGILKVHLPKGEQEQPRRIPVTEASD
jgi:HSP20 family protein